MCGIGGVVSFRNDGLDFDLQGLNQIGDQMRRRGPDGSGIWVNDQRTVGFVHRRLSIIDLSEAGAQPMHTSDGRYVIVFNGEIYNYRDLRKELERKAVIFRSNSDTEVILQLFSLYGTSMLTMLRGMYALAIWDSIESILFLARDPFGIKPLYFSENKGSIRFASQVKALLAGGEVDDSIDSAGLVGYFLWGHVPEPFTLYKGIRPLAPGTWLKVSAEGATEGRFIDVAKEIGIGERESRPMEPEECVAALRETLLDSVNHHLIADVPIGFFLSAGLDSTTLLALASESGYPLSAFTLGFREFDGTPNDETGLARQIAQRYGASHATRWVGCNDFVEDSQSIFQAMDQPTTDGINTYFVCKEAAAAGLKVAISGLGGDELFASYPSFKEIPALVRYTAFPSRLPGLKLGFRWASSSVLKRFTSPKWAGLFEYGNSYGGAYLLRRGHYMPWELPEIVDPDLARDGLIRLETMSRLAETTKGIARPRGRVAALEIFWYMRNQLLRDTDWASMAHSLEVRVPLLDIKVLKHIALVSASIDNFDKSFLGLTPRERLPDAVLNRPKTGFSIPVQQWINREGSSYPGRGLRGWGRAVIEDWKVAKNYLVRN